MKITAYSKGGFSNWYFLEPLKLLLDAGEGANAALGGRALSIRDLFLSHSHTDHISGLYSLLVSRATARAKNPALERLRITYPHNAPELHFFLHYLCHVVPHWQEVFELHPIQAGASFDLLSRDDILATALPMQHIPHEDCFGLRLDQKRKKLRPDILALPHKERAKRIQTEGADALSHEVHVPLIAYTGDGKPLQDPRSHKVELLIHEATFLDPDTSERHSTLREALEVHKKMEARHLLLVHFSQRYTAQNILQALENHPPNASVHPLTPGKVVHMDLPISGL